VETVFLECVKKIATSMGKIIISGFVHGVLNTDNFNVTGEVFDLVHGGLYNMQIKILQQLILIIMEGIHLADSLKLHCGH
jgi:tRNA A-37 threonylcarbamoyl transferase component Bud32